MPLCHSFLTPTPEVAQDRKGCGVPWQGIRQSRTSLLHHQTGAALCGECRDFKYYPEGLNFTVRNDHSASCFLGRQRVSWHAGFKKNCRHLTLPWFTAWLSSMGMQLHFHAGLVLLIIATNTRRDVQEGGAAPI